MFTVIPAGPASVLCIYRTLNNSKKSGYFSGLGAGTADGIFSAIAGFGISIIIDTVKEHEVIFKGIAFVVLIALGIRILFVKTQINVKDKYKESKSGLFGDYISTLLVTISNPMGIFGFAAVFTGINILSSATNREVWLIVLGVMSGAAIGWFILISVVTLLKKKIKVEKLSIINKIAGTVIILFAVYLFVSMFIDSL